MLALWKEKWKLSREEQEGTSPVIRNSSTLFPSLFPLLRSSTLVETQLSKWIYGLRKVSLVPLSLLVPLLESTKLSSFVMVTSPTTSERVSTISGRKSSRVS